MAQVIPEQYDPDAVSSPAAKARRDAIRARLRASESKGKAFESRVEEHLSRKRRIHNWIKGWNPDQPRVPAGSSDGGQFGSGGSLVEGESWADRKTRAIGILTRHGDPLTGPDSTWKNYNPNSGKWSPPSRQAQHDEIVQKFIQAAIDRGVPADHQALIAGGLGGAGKTTVLNSETMQSLGVVDPSQFLTVNPDDIKAEMASRGMIPTAEGLTPMECSPWVHEEASQIAVDLATEAQHQGLNLTWDITMSTQQSGENRLSSLAWSGYTAHGVFVDVPPQQSLDSADYRYQHGMDDFANGQSYGGRLLTSSDPQALRDPSGTYQSANASNFMANTDKMAGWVWFDNAGFKHSLVAGGGDWLDATIQARQRQR